MRSAAKVCGAIVVCGLPVACEQRLRPKPPVESIAPDAPEAQRGAQSLSPGIWRYTTRGRIERLPKATGVARDLAIHHEALTAFYARDGSNVGMKEMVMDFPTIAPGVSLEGLALDDVVVFDFDVAWASRDVWTVTRIKRLPKDTPLALTPPSAAPESPK